MTLGRRVSERMIALGLSQAELARRVGVSQPTIFNVIHRSKKGTTHLHRIARELGTTPAYLTGETDDPQADVPDAPELSREEVQWVAYWRMLDGDERRTMVDLIELLMRHRGPIAPIAKAA